MKSYSFFFFFFSFFLHNFNKQSCETMVCTVLEISGLDKIVGLRFSSHTVDVTQLARNWRHVFGSYGLESQHPVVNWPQKTVSILAGIAKKLGR